MPRDRDAAPRPARTRITPGKRSAAFARPRAGAPWARFEVRRGVTTIEAEGGADALELSADQLSLLASYARVRPVLGSDLAVARAIGVERTRLIAWKSGEAQPSREHLRILADLATAVGALSRAVHPSAIQDWLTAPKLPLANLTPLEALREGRLADVLQAADAAEHDAYA